MDIRWIESARAAFEAIYPAGKGVTVCNAVIPGVMGNFRRCLLTAGEGETLRQEYKTDDKRSVTVVVTGHREDGRCIVTDIKINGAALELGANGLVL